MVDISKYFERINYKGSTDVSYETLRGIHKAQVFSVPFENLEIHDTSSNPENLRRLDEKTLVNKILGQKRGGACMEINELFALVLLQLGFNVKRLIASVRLSKTRTHKCLLVTIGSNKYLADTGYGGNCIIEPLSLIHDTPFKQFSETFKLMLEYPRSEEIEEYVLYALIKEDWVKLYSFPCSVHLPEEYEPLNYFNSHSKNAFPVNNRLVTIPTPEGRIILHNYNLKIRRNGHQQTIVVKEEEYLNALDKYFALKFPSDTIFKPIPYDGNNE
jgi:N-hydroxyarylamine O-acetyltransferase